MSTSITLEPAPAEEIKPGPSIWLGLRSWKVLVGLGILALFALVAVVGPYIDHVDPSATSTSLLEGPSSVHLLGTTRSGQDVLAQLIVGSRSSLIVGFASAAIATLLSLLIGLTGGYLGGLSDEALSALSNIVLVIPTLPLVIVLAGYLPSKGNLGVLLVISSTGWAWGARVLRAQTLSIRRRDFVYAAKIAGERFYRVLSAEVLPNELAIVATTFLFTAIFAILTQSSLAFLGLSDVSTWSWGTMLYWADGSQALEIGAWWWFIPPGLCIALVGMSLALINFGIDEFINPRLRIAGIGTRKYGRALRRQTSASAQRTRTPPDRPAANPTQGARPPDVHGGELASPGIPLLELQNLSVDYGYGNRAVRAVDTVSLVLQRGEVLGIAGESGCGKSTLAFAMTRLLRPPGRISTGRAIFHANSGESVDILELSGEELRVFRWEQIAIVFQSAMNALNPVLSLRDQIEDVLVAHRPEMDRDASSAHIAKLLKIIGISQDRMRAYPHELSGGMRQRAMIAMALALEPDVLVMDEPTTALDVVMQRQILAEIAKLRHEFGFSVIFITHDLSLLIELSDRIAVMYAGKVVELAEAQELYRKPRHPYTYGLLNSFPRLRGERSLLTGIRGFPPDLRDIPSGCSFNPRCDHAMRACTTTIPGLKATGRSEDSGNHLVRCLLYDLPPSSSGGDDGLIRAPNTGLSKEVLDEHGQHR